MLEGGLVGIRFRASKSMPGYNRRLAGDGEIERRTRVHNGMVGTRGVPARYGGFETAVEEIGRRLADRGHEVTVYCRPNRDDGPVPDQYLGMRLVHLPALHSKALETLTHTAVSAIHALTHRRLDVAFLFNAANAPFLPVVRRRGTRVAVHVDGLEWRRAKWGPTGRRYYRCNEALSVRWADALIADARAIADYYRDEFSATTEVIPYGAPVIQRLGTDRLSEFGVEAGEFHVAVARFEPENHVEQIVGGYRRSAAALPLLVVGGAPYGDDYTDRVHTAAAGDRRIRFLGGVWDQVALDQLYHHAATYLHGHSVGGTNPSLLRAMGAGTAVIAFDVVFNREVLGEAGAYFESETTLAELLEKSEADLEGIRRRGDQGRRRVLEHYRWVDVAERYELLAEHLLAGRSRRRQVSGRRTGDATWRVVPTVSSSR